MRFEGKVALISAAGAGIGRATAGIIGREGGTVVAVDVDQGALDRLTTEIAGAGGRAVGIRADALDALSVEDTGGPWTPTATSTSSSMRWAAAPSSPARPPISMS
jgi:NAD(P)-dependent dehydrogenase (short-subunit alcohol dehydrogenase family)